MKIVFIAFNENSHGRKILRLLLESGNSPIAILMGSKKAQRKYRKRSIIRYLKRNGWKNTIWRIWQRLTTTQDVKRTSVGKDIQLRKSIIDQSKANNIPLHRFDSMEAQETLSYLASLSPDIIVLGGAPILKEKALKVPKIATLNSHPGILPEAKGMDVIGHSIINNIPLGATVFSVDKGIDSGDIILKNYLKDPLPATLEELEAEIENLCASLMIEAIGLILSGQHKFIPQDPRIGQIFKAMTSHERWDAQQILSGK